MCIRDRFTIGKNARDAVKVAVMLEEVARCMHLSRQLGDPIRLPQDMVDKLFDRYQNVCLLYTSRCV